MGFSITWCAVREESADLLRLAGPFEPSTHSPGIGESAETGRTSGVGPTRAAGGPRTLNGLVTTRCRSRRSACRLFNLTSYTTSDVRS